jgi:hypothetical protein
MPGQPSQAHEEEMIAGSADDTILTAFLDLTPD